jgi:tetratricopeptide (TPR) repeat protein
MLWFFLLLIPSAVLTVLDQGEPMAEHRVYAASAGLFLAAGAAIGWIAHRLEDARPWVRFMAGTGFAVVVLSLSVQTMLRNEVWASPIALWQESVDLDPQHPRPRLLLGEALQDAGRLDEAAQQYRTAISLRPEDPTGHLKLGAYLAVIGEWPAAREQFLEVLRIDPGNATAGRAMTALDQLESNARTNDGRH